MTMIAKEARALWPIAAACLVTLAGGYVQQRGVLMDLSVAAFVIGPALLGAHAFGHEFSCRTLPMLLAQPVDRRRIFVLKWLTAAAMAAAITAAAAIVLPSYARGMWEHWNVLILPLAGGLLLVPWLAMTLRSTVAAVLAAGSVFALTLLGPTLLVALARGLSPDAAQDLVWRPWSAAMMALSIAGAVLARHRFSSLEVGDASPRSFTLPRVGTGSPRAFRPIAALAGKELQLQHLTLTLAALFVAAAIALIILQRTVTAWSHAPVAMLMSIYCMSLSLVTGAMASAEERQLGIAEWQLIQPVSTLTQWVIKVIVTVGLAIVLAALLPAMLLAAAVTPDALPWQVLLLPVTFLAAAGLYLSSLTAAGTWALILALPSVGAVLWFVSLLDAAPLALIGRSAGPLPALRPILWGLIPVLLALGYVNHISSQRRMPIVLAQVAALGAAIAVTRFVALTF